MFFQIFVNGFFFFFLLPYIQWPGPVPCVELEQTTFFKFKIISLRWSLMEIGWRAQFSGAGKWNMFEGGSCINIKSRLKLSKTNTGLKSGVIFPPKVLGKLSVAFQIPNLKCDRALWNWRLTTDVDFYTRFSGFSKWQIYRLSSFIADGVTCWPWGDSRLNTYIGSLAMGSGKWQLLLPKQPTPLPASLLLPWQKGPRQ